MFSCTTLGQRQPTQVSVVAAAGAAAAALPEGRRIVCAIQESNGQAGDVGNPGAA